MEDSLRTSRGSEAREVLPDLPGGDLLVVAVPLVALDADDPVDDVLVAAAAERGAQHVVALELADGLERASPGSVSSPRERSSSYETV